MFYAVTLQSGGKKQSTAKIRFVNHWARQTLRTSLALRAWDPVLVSHHSPCLQLLFYPGNAHKVKGEKQFSVC